MTSYGKKQFKMSEEFDLTLSEGMRDFLGSKLANLQPEDRKEFAEFSAARLSVRMVQATIVISLVIVLYFFTMAMVHAPSGMGSWIIAAALIFTTLFRIPVFIFIFVVRRQDTKSASTEYLLSWAPFCESLLTLASTLSLGVCLLARIYNGKCQSLNQVDMWNCSSEFSSRALPQEHLVMLMMYPMVHSAVLKALKFEFVLASWSIAVIFMFAGVWMGNATQSLPAIIIYIPLSALTLFENHRQDLILYFVVKRQRKLLVENKQMSDDTATELRHMIANVAHDLKTPLSAFMSGVESISNLLDSIHIKRTDFFKDNNIQQPLEVTSDRAQIKENIKNLINTNDFMLMTINRCIDYTKASKGLKLDPRLETVNLTEILALPIQVMRDMQHRITVNLLPSPQDICSHIITDKQWLQENLFCLISNAVKYSSGGSVNVGMSLCRVDRLPKGAKHDTHGIHPEDAPLPCEEHHGTLSKRYSFLNLAALFKTVGGSSSRSNSSKVYATSDKVEMLSGGKSSHTMTSTSIVVPPLLELSVVNVSEVLLFEIEDTGIGLSNEMMNNLFTPFKQAQRRAGGTGLGLYSLAKRVEALGGYYGVQRRKDGREGSLFWFAIPYTPDRFMQQQMNLMSSKDTPMSPVASPSDKQPSPTTAPQKLNILVVDDSLTILKMSSMMLRRQGHNVTQAENGAEALQKIAAGCGVQLEDGTTPMVSFDIVLMDLNMPVMDGLEATSRLRAQELIHAVENEVSSAKNGQAPHQFVVGFSANSDHDTMLEAYAAGVDDFISKPFALQTFYDVYNKRQLATTKSTEM